MQTIKNRRMLMGAFLTLSVLILMGATKGLQGDPTRAEFEQLRARLEAAEGVIVPLGGVIAWWGSLDEAPANFEICDGAAPTTPGATLTGNKPDLTARFIRGAEGSRIDVQAENPTGGADTIAARSTDPTALTVDHLPSHSHSVTDPGHAHPITDPGHNHNFRVPTAIGGSTSIVTVTSIPLNNGTSGFNTFNLQSSNSNVTVNSNTTGVSIDETGGDMPHDHGIGNHDNRPAYLELFYIIRVK